MPRYIYCLYSKKDGDLQKYTGVEETECRTAAIFNLFDKFHISEIDPDVEFNIHSAIKYVREINILEEDDIT